MRLKVARLLIGGSVGSVAASLVAGGLFIGVSGGILFNPQLQSPKLIAVWREIAPLPLIVSNPGAFHVGIAILGIIHALVYAMIRDGLPGEGLRKGVSFGFILWTLQATFFEYFTPFNLFGEPPTLVLFQLVLWVPVTQVEGLIIAAIYGQD